MTRFFCASLRLVLALVLVNCSLIIAQAQAPKTYSSSEILQGLKKLDTLGSVMYIAAHPDDENTRLLAYLANERHLETSYLSLTRGDGGQDLIGPELREQLGVIRTQELLAARRIDGAKQFFTRANDFGFSKTSQEALSVWDHQQVLSDAVWIIRQQRPDVLITRFPPDPRAGHGHHQASAIIAAEAFDAAGDPKRFPEQLKYVQVWQPKRLYWNTGSFFVKPGENMDGYLKLDAGGYNPLLGQSYGEIAAHSRSQHRSQGFGAAAQRGEAIEYFQFVKGTPAKTDLFEGIDQTWNRVPGGAAIGKMVEDVIRKYDASNPSASVAGLEKVFQGLASLMTVDKDHFWIQKKLQEESVLMQACAGVYAEATVSEPALASGGEALVTYDIINRSGLPIRLEQVRLSRAHFKGDATTITLDDEAPDSKQAITLGAGKHATGTLPLKGFTNALISQPYWLREPGSVGMYKLSEPESDYLRGQPENDPVATATFRYAVGEKRFKSITVPVQYKHTDPVLGELYEPLVVVPPVLVNIPAAQAYVFADQQAKPVPVTLRAGAAGVSGSLALQVPAGWQAEPAAAPFSFKSKDEEQTVTFMLRPLGGAAEGKSELRAVATVGGQSYSRGIQTIKYPHIPTQTLFPEASAPLVRLRVARGHTQTIGYLMGAGDQVPEALRQLGYAVTLLNPATDLTPERLARYDAVVLGVRAYNTVEQLKTQQPALLRYVENGGTLLVQYVVNRGTVLPEIGPYPLTLSNNRITVENTPVTFLKPSVPLLSAPNQLTPADFATGWVQEQGLYYPSAWDAHYQPVIASHDPGEAEQQSAILVAPYGKGRYIYTGLALFRQLPAGVPGAYRVLANLVESNGK
ncbi:LmbE family protein [Hymenobacter sp. RP-2-7]|uniref:LmbE family protein n=1 Tax=Hymenobacter polaris TaxID=2682546 RepID=A0A7Y0AAD6_9BACT|nr:PIG-L family deacetylase [Hymenobacter polaris]NML63730.1 LmbE family protein [Hymenobacter polaris]